MRLPELRSFNTMRVLAATVLIFFASQLVVLTLLWREQRRDAGQFILPLPARVSAIVELVENSPPDQRALIMRTLNSSELRLTILDEVSIEKSERESIRLRAFKEAVKAYGTELRNRQMYAMVDASARRFGNPTFTEDGVRADFPMRLVVELNTGEWLSIETPSLFEVRFRNLPVGLFAGLFGLVVASLALISILRQFRPVRDMAIAARSFSRTGKPLPVKTGGSKDIRELVEAFNALQQRVSELLANRTLVMSAMSHDVRTYLTRLRLRIEMMDETNRLAAERTIGEIQALLDDTLTFAQSESGGMTGEAFDLEASLRSLIEEGQFGVRVRLSTSGPCIIRADEPRLRRALVNLITNAIKYGEEADIHLNCGTEKVEIIIADPGPGIPLSERDKVFEPFYRQESSRNRSKEGAGLGLAIAHTIIVGHGGQITLEDREGGGLLVRVTLPVKQD